MDDLTLVDVCREKLGRQRLQAVIGVTNDQPDIADTEIKNRLRKTGPAKLLIIKADSPDMLDRIADLLHEAASKAREQDVEQRDYTWEPE
jgi:hypothetical protein